MSNDEPPGNDHDASLAALAETQLSPLSIQAAALVRSIEALSTIFWITIGGMFLSVFFAGLNQLEVNVTSDFIQLGEYQVPKSILPLASLAIALFALWMTANRLNMLGYVLDTSRLPTPMVHEIFHLNPPVLHVFDEDNINPWWPFSGVSVLVVLWAVFFGNVVSLTWASAVQRSASISEFDAPLLTLYMVATVAVLIYGARSLAPPLRNILSHLHDVDFRIGWPRQLMAGVIALCVVGANHWDQIQTPMEQADDLLGPAIGNAINGETVYIRGVEVKLFGIAAMEHDQVCQTAEGDDYPCGRVATQTLQEMLQDVPVICWPFLALSDQRVVGACELVTDTEPTPRSPGDFLDGFRINSVSRLMVVQGHALAVGQGIEFFGDEQQEAQVLREGIWQGSFQPPSTYRR